VVTVICVLAADHWWPAGWIAIAVMAGLGNYLGTRRLAIAWLLCGAVATGVFLGREANRKRAEIGLMDQGGVVKAKLLGDAKGRDGFWSAPAKLESGPFHGTHVWWQGTGELPLDGARIEGRGNFSPLREPRNPEEFDQAAWHRRKGIAAAFRGNTVSSETGWWAAFGGSIRKGFREAVTTGLDPESQEARVIRAIVIGEQPADAEELVAAFRNSGTLHIFSVSGMHVAMVGGIAWLVLRKAGVSRRYAVLAILPLIFGYSWITGNSAPAVRSAWMMAVFLMAFVFRRQPDLLNALGAVLLAAMLWDGNLLFQPGVQLSYGVVAAIAIGTTWGVKPFEWIGKKEEYLPDSLMTGWQKRQLMARRSFAKGLGVSTAAWVGSTPLTVFHFGLVTPIALVGTLVLSLPVFWLLSLSLFSAAIHPVSPVGASMVNRLNGKLADGCVKIASALSSVPGSHFETRRPGEPMLLVYDLEYGAGAACFTGANGSAVMIDCGDRQAFQYQITRSLRGLGISPDSVVLSHGDAGHIAGITEVTEAFPIKQVWLPVKQSRSAGYQEWISKGPELGVSLLHAEDLHDIPLPAGAWLEVLHAPDPEDKNILADDRVAVFRLHWHGWKLLMTSDSGYKTERALLASGKDLSADVIIAGRHRRDPSLGDEFLAAVNPQAILASHSLFPAEERLAPKQVDYWRSRGLKVVNQGDAGGVTVRLGADGDLLLEGYVDGSVIRLSRQ